MAADNIPNWEKVKDIFALAIEQSESSRANFLSEACGADEKLLKEVESLLGAHAAPENLIEKNALQFAPLLEAGDQNYAGRIFGKYRIVREIGRGGMGAVFLAERNDGEFSQQVALKIVRRSFADNELGRRFRQERQILASLNHPHIARLLDGGVAEDGEPFLAMEYVAGERIDDYCARKNFSIGARLKLFLDVCGAVSFAHQNLVIHRDLKPSNILVTEDGAPKLLDFGIAKLLDAEQAGETTQTAFRAFTPEYAAPEQIEGKPITTAADVFSLGVLLEEILSGKATGKNGDQNLADISDEKRATVAQQTDFHRWRSKAETISENETLPVNVQTNDERRAAPLPKILNPKPISDELKNIIAMARRAEPARRYASVQQFAEDLERYLGGLPVRAQRDSFGYRARKFIGRNKSAMTAAAIVLLAVFAALAVSLWQTANARRQRDLARAAQSKSERINGFLREMLSFSNQSYTSVAPVPHAKNVTVNEMLDKIAPRIETELADEPEVRAQILRTIGSAYASQGFYEEAEKFLREALNTQTEIFGEESDETMATAVELGVLNYRQTKFDEADALLGKAVAFHRRAREESRPQFRPVNLIRAMDHWGTNKLFKGDIKACLSILEEALQYAEQANLTGAEREAVASVEQDFGASLVIAGDFERGEPFIRRAVENYRQLSSEPRWELGNAVNSLAVCLFKHNQPDEALKFFQEAEQILRQTLGEKNYYLAINLNWQARIYSQKNDLPTAEAKVRASLAIFQSLYPTTNSFSANTYVTLGSILTKSGRAREAENILRQTLSALEETATKNYPFIVSCKIGLSESLLAQNRISEAERIATEARDEAAHNLGEQSSWVKMATDNLTKIYEKRDKSGSGRKP